MKCDQEMFEALKQALGPDCYDPKAKLEWIDAQPMLTLNGEKLPVMRETWFSLAQTSNMRCECIPCISQEPLEVIALKSTHEPEKPIYGLLAINRTGEASKDYCGYNYNPVMVELLLKQK